MSTSYVMRYIAEGEHQQQDFKMRVDDAKKIARTLAAFANSDGGRLLIGVKDNGNISGVNVDEELHMIEAAAQMYCRPEIKFEYQSWKVEFKSVLEVIIQPSLQRPHIAINEEDEWRVYIRRDDQNLPAPAVLMEVWKGGDDERIDRYFHTEKEKKLFAALENTQGHTLSKLCRLTGIDRSVMIPLLAQFIRWELIELFFVQDQALYRLK